MEFLPAPGQGAIVIECRADDEATLALLAQVDHAPTRAAAEAERGFLAALGSGCTLPVGAYAQVDGDLVALRAMIADAETRHAALRRRQRARLPRRSASAAASASACWQWPSTPMQREPRAARDDRAADRARPEPRPHLARGRGAGRPRADHPGRPCRAAPRRGRALRPPRHRRTASRSARPRRCASMSGKARRPPGDDAAGDQLGAHRARPRRPPCRAAQGRRPVRLRARRRGGRGAGRGRHRVHGRARHHLGDRGPRGGGHPDHASPGSRFVRGRHRA